MFFDCACVDFAGTVAPEETQRCALVEWVRGRLRRVLWEEELGRLAEEARDAQEMDMVSASEVGSEQSEWEVLSDAVGEGWSVVSEESQFEMLDV